ncbi:hypothetical protein GW17_00010340, partial [Ensete ventricosum]
SHTPPPPSPFFFFFSFTWIVFFSLQMTAVKQFSLREGLDNTGVVTKILTCNCSMEMAVDNYSKVFGLHLRPSVVEMAFEHMKFASSQTHGSYIDTDSSSALTLYSGTKNKPMYGAGRSMQDLLESGRGLTLLLRVRSTSTYRVIGNLVRSTYRHDAQCQLVLRGGAYGHTVIYNSTCFISTTHAS